MVLSTIRLGGWNRRSRRVRAFKRPRFASPAAEEGTGRWGAAVQNLRARSQRGRSARLRSLHRAHAGMSSRYDQREWARLERSLSKSCGLRPPRSVRGDERDPTYGEWIWRCEHANAGGSIDVHIANCVNPSALVPLALTISSKSVSVVIFVDETVHSMPRPLSYDKSEMSHEN